MLELSLPSAGDSLPARHIHEPVFPPTFWEEWIASNHGCKRSEHCSPAAGEFRSHSFNTLLDAHERLVVVSPHPDDEVLMCSGLILEQSRRGRAIEVFALTDGEACFGSESVADNVGMTRRREAARGLQVLGVNESHVTNLGLPDGRLIDHVSTIRKYLLDFLEPGDLVVTTWRFDGHPDHEAAAQASAAACAKRNAGLLEAPVWMWHWAEPGHVAIEWSRLIQLPLSERQANLKWEALQCHQSQLSARDGLRPVVDVALQARAKWPFECFFGEF